MSASSTDRAIVITGAARGIGIEWVKQYAKEQTFIVAVVRSPESATELKKLAGDKIVIVKGDMEQPETFDAVAQEIAKYTGGRVDLLINNAGAWFGAGATPGKQITASTPGEWTRTFQLNTIGPIFFTKAMIPQLQKGTEKRVVNIGSFLGSIDFHKATQAYAYVSYSAAKLALSFATLKYAQEFPTITFIDLNPGFVGTELHNVGREHAPLTTEQSVLRCKSFVDRVTTADSGEAFSLDGLREMVAA